MSGNTVSTQLFIQGTSFDQFVEEKNPTILNNYWLLFREVEAEVNSFDNLWPIIILIPLLWLEFMYFPHKLFFIIVNTGLLASYAIVWTFYPVMLRRFSSQSIHAINTFMGALIPMTTIFPGYYLLEAVSLTSQQLLYFCIIQLLSLIVPPYNAYRTKEILYNLNYTYPKTVTELPGEYILDVLSWLYSGDLKKELLGLKQAQLLTETDSNLTNVINLLSEKFEGTDVAPLVNQTSEKLKELPERENIVECTVLENGSIDYSIHSQPENRINENTSGIIEKLIRYINNSSNPEKRITPENSMKEILVERKCCDLCQSQGKDPCILCGRTTS